MSEFALDAPITQIGEKILEVETAIFVEDARARPRRVTEEHGVAIQCRKRLPRRGASGEGLREGLMRHQEFMLLQSEKVADASVVVARRRR